MTGTGMLPAPVTLLGVRIHPIHPEELLASMVSWGREHRLRRIYYVNVHAMNLAYQDPTFRRYLNNADLAFCDGVGVQWVAHLIGVQIPCRMTPPDWIDAFAAATAAARQSVFALGDEEGVAERFQRRLSEEHPEYRCAGYHDGFFRKEGAENDAVIRMINDSEATHLLVGLGMPLQERWIEANIDRLSVKTVVPVGALFRWHAGVEKRAPRWMSDNGLEWLARFVRHPVRHFRRYVVGNPLFAYRALFRRAPRQ